MKPTPSHIQRSRFEDRSDVRVHRRFSHAVCEFQPWANDLAPRGSTPQSDRLPQRLRAFREIAGKFQRNESPRHFRGELCLFGLIVLAALWPVLAAVAALRGLANL